MNISLVLLLSRILVYGRKIYKFRYDIANSSVYDIIHCIEFRGINNEKKRNLTMWNYIGANLTWFDDDIKNAVYSFDSEVFNYNDDCIKHLDLEENSFVKILEFIENNTKVKATIETGSGEEESLEFEFSRSSY